MNSDKKSAYHFSILGMFRSVFSNMFSNEWTGWTFISLLSILLVVVWMPLGQKYLSTWNLVSIVDSLVIAIMFGTWGYLGYLTAKHRFFPSNPSFPITGKSALLVGIIMMIIGWGFTAYSLYLGVLRLLAII